MGSCLGLRKGSRASRRRFVRLGGRRKKKHSEGNKEKLPTAKATSQDAPFLGHRDRLLLRRRPCPNATLRYSRTNGKVFLIFPTSILSSQVAPSPLPSPLFWSHISVSVTRWPTPGPPHSRPPPPYSLLTSSGHPGQPLLAGAGSGGRGRLGGFDPHC